MPSLVRAGPVAGIVGARTGFPFTPQLGYNPSDRKALEIRFVPSSIEPLKVPCPRQAESVAQSRRFHCAALRLLLPQESGRAGHLGFLRAERHSPAPALDRVVSRRDLQLAESKRLQYAEFDRFHAAERRESMRLSRTAGAVTSTATTSRQVQFALTLLW